MNYPGWYVLDVQSFKAYHGPMGIRAAIFLLAPRVIELVLAVIVLARRPEGIDRWVIVAGIVMVAGGILSTLLISRPIHARLDLEGNTPELVSRLIHTDWIRNVLEFSRAALYVWALSRLINPSVARASRVAP